jgi:hypothetical protein
MTMLSICCGAYVDELDTGTFCQECHRPCTAEPAGQATLDAIDAGYERARSRSRMPELWD